MKTRFSFGLVLAVLGVACSSPMADDLGASREDVHESDPVVTLEAPALAVDDAPVESEVAKAPLESALVFHTGGRPYLVLDEAPNLALALGKPEVVSAKDEGIYAVKRAVDLDHAAKAHVGAIGSRVRLRNATGAVCEAIVDGLAFVGRVSPDGEATTRWAGEGRDENDKPIAAPSRDELADEAWDMVDGSVVLAATLRPIGACKDATFATTRVMPTSAAITTADDTTTASALSALRAMPEYAQHATEYLEFARETESTETAARWEQHAEASPRVTTTTLDGARYVFVAAGTAAGCGDFGAELSVLFRETDGGLEVVRVLDGFTGELQGVLMGEEGVELVFPESHVGSKDTEVRRIEVRTYGCSC